LSQPKAWPLVTQLLASDPFAGDVFVFRAKRMDRVKILIWDGSGLCLVTKRLETGGFTWPPVRDGSITLTPGQLRLLFTGMDRTQIATRPMAQVENLQHKP
jgi:transposase